AEALHEHGSRADVPQLGLDEGAQVAGRAVLHRKHQVEVVVVLDDHARTHLGGGNRHRKAPCGKNECGMSRQNQPRTADIRVRLRHTPANLILSGEPNRTGWPTSPVFGDIASAKRPNPCPLSPAVPENSSPAACRLPSARSPDETGRPRPETADAAAP